MEEIVILSHNTRTWDALNEGKNKNLRITAWLENYEISLSDSFISPTLSNSDIVFKEQAKDEKFNWKFQAFSTHFVLSRW